MMSRRLCHGPLQAEQEPVVGLGPLPVMHLVTVSIPEIRPANTELTPAVPLVPAESRRDRISSLVFSGRGRISGRTPIFQEIQDFLKNRIRWLDIQSPTCFGLELTYWCSRWAL